MKPTVEKGPLVLLYNPFIYIAGGKALVLGLGALLVTALLGVASNTHFDGVLDTHTGAAAPLWFFLSEGILDWLCLAVVLWLAGRLISKTSFRTIDVLGTQTLARWPAILIALVTLPKGFQRFGNSLVEQFREGKTPEFNTADALVFVAAIGVMLLGLVWMVVLMYKAFSISCNVKGGKAIGTFIVSLFAAEVLSKLALSGLVLLTAAGPHPSTRQALHRPGMPGDWVTLSGSREQWNWTNDTFTGHSTAGDSILASTKQYSDVTLSALVSTTNREASLALRVQDANNGYIAVFLPQGTPAAVGVGPRLILIKRKAGQEQELGLFKKADLSAPGKLEELTFAARGPQLEVRLNGETVLRATDTSFSSGLIGLRVCGDAGMPCDGTFSNLTVRP